MKQYIGTKIVKAWPARRYTFIGGKVVYACVGEIVPSAYKTEEGYRIEYEDGYLSWSPKKAFEKAYRQTTGMNFGLAIEAAKMGKRIARAGWNGKNQYVELGVNFSYYDPSGICEETHHEDIGSEALVFVGTRGRQVGWLASQSDMLADDWYIVE